MSITEIPKRNPSAPNDLTEVATSKPAVPASVTEKVAVTPANPVNLTELAKVDPANPANLTELAKSDPANPVNLTEIAKLDPANPVNLTELSASAPAVPVNLTETALSSPAVPVNLTEVASAGINRTLSPLFNFNASLGLPAGTTFTRASSASYLETYKGPLGRFQTRITEDYVGSVENLSKYSEDFDNAAWAISGNITKAKSLQGHYLITDTGDGDDFMASSITVAADSNFYTSFIDVKPSNDTGIISLYLVFTGGTTRVCDVQFDLNNGIITSQDVISTGFIKYLADGWYRIGVTGDNNGTNTALQFRLYPAFNTSGGVTRVNATTGSVLVRKAQTTQSTKLLPYVRTFDVAVTETFTASPRYEEKGLLVEGVSTNLITYSEDFADASWSKLNATITNNASLAPDGSFSASKFVETTANGVHRITRAVTATATNTYTSSCFVKSQNYTSFLVGFTDLAAEFYAAKINLKTGIVTVESNAVTNLTGVGVSAEDIGNGWFKVSATVVTNSTSLSAYLRSVDENGDLSYAGVTDYGTFIWGSQLEELPFASSYIKTEGSTVTRAVEAIFKELPFSSNAISILVECAYNGSSSDLGGGRAAFSIYNDTTSSFNRIISFNNGGNASTFRVRSGNIVQKTFINSLITEDQQLITSVVSIDGAGDGVLYTEGVAGDSVVGLTFPIDMNKVVLGATSDTGGTTLYGHIKRAEVYDTGLTANEVKLL